MRRLALAVCLLLATVGCLGGVQNDLVDDADAGPTADPFGDAPANGTLTVHAIDVGQADATLVVGPEGDTVLIDAGGWQDDGETVIGYLDARGIDRIDALVSTHAHADHVGGAAAVIEHVETSGDGVGTVYDSGVPHTSQTYERYLDAIEEHEVTLYRTESGDEIPIDGAHVAVLNPPSGTDREGLHENSVAVRVAHGDAAFLFTGDAETDVEQRLVGTYGDELDATGLQAGHHGSSTSSSAPFLDAVDPSFAVVSAAHDSQYGHPHEETLQRFAARDVDVYWTGVHGTIVAESDGDRVRVGTVAEATVDPTRLPDATAADAAATDAVAVRETYDADARAATASATPGVGASGSVASAGVGASDGVEPLHGSTGAASAHAGSALAGSAHAGSRAPDDAVRAAATTPPSGGGLA